ncbi:polyketide synthase [Actinophytocola xinjiangensis]|uniref:Polyketide synthase n=1 Tax=Actinophytocola xinjiangensis TaxID=485602 RepID=A0A7Z1AUC8_9PSEU|nr:TcmI family type II polyketide cyclase [Actinophytocola xinjiangensis]OLF05882.1 polyketide synthase [Actinophytocola xinjiangensis]
MHRSLIVARIMPDSQDKVAQIWADSDATELPGIAGVEHRSLWTLGDVYIQLLETAEPGQETINRIKGHPEFVGISEKLSEFISPYLSTWRSPKDAQARCFYTYEK